MSGYRSVGDLMAWQEATRRIPRVPGEDICEWAEKVERLAKELSAPRAPYVERVPGEDDDE